MKARLSSDPRTEPLPPGSVRAWRYVKADSLKPPPDSPTDNPALRRLITWGLGLGSLWLLGSVLAQAWPALFPGPAQVLKTEVARATNPPPAPYQGLPAPRALPVTLQANAAWVLAPFFGAVLLFSWRQLSRTKT
jgi:hypothetical protein